MIGTQIGPFVLLRLLGAGGMGSVYLAEHSLMKDLHAIKILAPELTRHPQLVTRFINEARAAAKLRHRNLIRVHNIDRMPDDGPWFMVLDYLEGSTLSRFIASHRGPVPTHLVLHILAQVASCMQLVHDHKIVHRDLKPGNIFLVQAGEDQYFPVVLDLGVAQLSEDLASGPATTTGTVLGTPIYMAPEQLRGERVSPAADVFALGVIAYEMSTGGYFPYQYDEPRSEYVGLPATEIYYRQRSALPVDPRRRHSGLGGAWVHAVMAALDREPARRPASARDLALLLAGAVAPGGGHPAGIDIVHQVARELTPRASGARAVLSSSSQTEDAPSSSDTTPGYGIEPQGTPGQASAEIAVVQPPMTTLAGTASQSIPAGPAARPGRRWTVIAGAAVATALVGALVVFTVRRSASSEVAPSPGQGLAVTSSAETSVAAKTAVAEPPTVAVPAHVTQAALADAGVGADGGAGEITPEVIPARPATTAEKGRRDLAENADAPDRRPRVAPPHRSPETSRKEPQRPPPPVASQRTGELWIIVRPWALIRLDGKPFGQTPFRRQVPAGNHSVQITNDVAGKDETVTVIVAPDKLTKLERSW